MTQILKKINASPMAKMIIDILIYNLKIFIIFIVIVDREKLMYVYMCVCIIFNFIITIKYRLGSLAHACFPTFLYEVVLALYALG